MIGFLLNNNLAPIGSSVISTCSPADLFEQRERNVPLASADVRGGGILRDEPKERLRRRLPHRQHYLFKVVTVHLPIILLFLFTSLKQN